MMWKKYHLHVDKVKVKPVQEVNLLIVSAHAYFGVAIDNKNTS